MAWTGQNRNHRRTRFSVHTGQIPMGLKDKIVRHYDVLSPYYKELWGIHIHHGYWKTGNETKEQAQEQLIRELISRADIKNGVRVLDVGCGIGGTAIYLHKALGAKVTGITISPNQIEIGNKLARRKNAKIKLMLIDADRFNLDNNFDREFDIIWSVEAISHFHKKASFFSFILPFIKDRRQIGCSRLVQIKYFDRNRGTKIHKAN